MKLQREHEDCDVPAFDIATLVRPASKHKPINKKKLEDINKLLQHIPTTSRGFYSGLTTSIDDKESNASESDEETTPSVKATRARKPGTEKSSTS